MQNFQADHIAGMKIEESFGRFDMLCKCGTTCRFGIEQISNQVHLHNCYELYIILSGTGRYIHGEKEYIVNEGDIAIADKNTLHEFQSFNMQGMNLLYIFFNISVNNSIALKSMEDSLIQNFLTKHDIVAPQKNYLLSYLNFIESYQSEKRSCCFGIYHALKNLILESIAVLSFSVPLLNTQTISQNTFERILDYIDANLHNKIRSSDLISVTHMSQRNIEYLFKKNLNRSIVGYINEKKVDRACHYLKMNFSVSETARLVGVSDTVQFSRLFKKFKDISPKKYSDQNALSKKGIGRRVD